MIAFRTSLSVFNSSASSFPSSSLSSRRNAHPKTPKKCNGPSMLFNWFQEDPVLDLDELEKQYPAIEVKNLTKTFKKRFKGPDKKKQSRTITAIDNLSFHVPRGRILGLLGPNSSGKTTTLRCMSTLSDPDSGSIQYYGVDAIKKSHIARNMIGFVAQSAGVDKVLTGREHLELFANLAHLSDAEQKRNIPLVIDLLNLHDFIDRQTSVYSGGVVRRLDIAIALLHQPPILILDEPTVGLDIETRMVIWDVLRGWRDAGGTIVLTSHYLEEVDVLSDQVGIMEKGVLLAMGTPTELKNDLGGDRISIRLEEFTSLEHAEAACHTLRSRGLAQEALVNRLQNNSIELVVDSDNGSIGSEVVQSLREQGFERLFSFSQSKPSLDDVYLAATGKSLKDADSSAKAQRSDKVIRQESMA